MAQFTEYEINVMDSIVDQGGDRSDFEAWYKERQQTSEKVVETPDVTIDKPTTTLPEEVETGIKEEIAGEETLGGAGVGLGALVGLQEEKVDPFSLEGVGQAAGRAIAPLGDALGIIKEGAEETVKGTLESGQKAFEGLASAGQKKTLDFANFLREKLGKEPITIEEATKAGLDPIGGLQSTIQEDILDIGEGSLGVGMTVAFPGTTGVLNTAAQTEEGRALLIPLSEGISMGGELVNKFPPLKAFRDSLPEDRRTDFDAFTAQIVALGLAKSTGEILSKYKASKAAKLNKQAESLVNEFIKPTKESTKTITKKITPEILERKIKGTREQVLEQAETGVKESGKAIENFIKEGKVKGDIGIDKLIDVLAKENSTLRFEGKILPGKIPQVKFIENTLDFLKQVKKQSGSKLSPEAQIQLKRSFDTIFDKAVTRDKIVKFQDDLQLKLADTLRAELAKNNPDFAKLNKDFSFFKGLETVMKETERRTTGQSAGLGGIISGGQKGAFGAGVGAAVGGSVAGTPGAFIGGTLGAGIGAKLQSIISNPRFKLISANKKVNLAKTLAEGNPSKIEKLLNSFAVTLETNK